MMPMLRFFRQGDGSFAHFNGISDTATDQLATVLAYDDSRAALPASAPRSGYQRIDAGTTTVIVDVGRPPPIEFSTVAHAGCLSFEMSVGHQRLMVNCGVPSPNSTSLRRLARTTAAHSTATVNDTSSCRFLTRTTIGDWLGEAVVAGPTRVDVDRQAVPGATVLAMRHNGYVERYRIVHERFLSLSEQGDRLEGTDSFVSPSGAPVGRGGKDTYAIRFHLFANVRATPVAHAVLLELPNGESWEFETDAGELVVEESILMSDTRGNRQTDQLVIYGRIQRDPVVNWRLHRTAFGRQRRRLLAPPRDRGARQS
jgi:uncharacterized heparinase superfamily protein